VIMRCAMRRIRKVSAKCTNTSFFHQYIRAWASESCRQQIRCKPKFCPPRG
jgi:hypothetical protein